MRAFVFLLPAIVLSSTMSWAGSLQVAPVSIEVQGPGAVATLKLRNEGTTSINAQLRVFRWSQANGIEKLELTEDVVASPPMTTIAPKADYTVRLVRTTKRALAAGETYRLLVDELPDPTTQHNRTVTLVLRSSIPVFFYSRDSAQAKLAWSIDQTGGRTSVSVTNTGNRHARISGLQLRDGKGSTVSFGSGLTGYALAGATMQWSAPPNNPRLEGSNSIVITGLTDSGPIDASASLRSGR